jgi:hypothetical protein
MLISLRLAKDSSRQKSSTDILICNLFSFCILSTSDVQWRHDNTTNFKSMDINDRLAKLEARVAALEGKTPAPRQKTVIKLYPQVIGTSGYAVKENDKYAPFDGSAAGELVDVQLYTSEYEGQPQNRLVFILEDGLTSYQINVGAKTVFARSLAAGLSNLTSYTSLVVGAKPSGEKKNAVFCDLRQYGEIVKSNCGGWGEDEVLDLHQRVTKALWGKLIKQVSGSIESGRLTKEDAIQKTTEMFNLGSLRDLSISQLRFLIAELRERI